MQASSKTKPKTVPGLKGHPNGCETVYGPGRRSRNITFRSQAYIRAGTLGSCIFRQPHGTAAYEGQNLCLRRRIEPSSTNSCRDPCCDCLRYIGHQTVWWGPPTKGPLVEDEETTADHIPPKNYSDYVQTRSMSPEHGLRQLQPTSLAAPLRLTPPLSTT